MVLRIRAWLSRDLMPLLTGEEIQAQHPQYLLALSTQAHFISPTWTWGDNITESSMDDNEY